MGLSSSKTKSTNAPTAYAKPYIDAGGAALGSAYQAASPIVNQVQSTLGAQLPGLAQQAFTPSAGLTAATDYNTKVASGGFLGQGNPYLQGQIDQTGADVTSRVQALFSQAGRTGSGANVNALSRGLASAENGLRYQDYSSERDRMAQAASLAPSLDAARYSGLGAYLQAAQAATGIGQDSAQQYASGLGSLFGNYNTQTGVTKPGLGLILAQAAASAASAYAGGKGAK